MKRPFILIGATAALVAAGAVIASEGHGRHGDRAERIDRMFERMDANKDGAIDASEREAMRAARFGAVDADGDGAITREEMRAHAVARATDRADAQFARLDGDGNGALDQSEVEARHERRDGRWLNRLDTDGDGRITREEALAAKPHRHGDRKAD